MAGAVSVGAAASSARLRGGSSESELLSLLSLLSSSSRDAAACALGRLCGFAALAAAAFVGAAAVTARAAEVGLSPSEPEDSESESESSELASTRARFVAPACDRSCCAANASSVDVDAAAAARR